MFDDAEFADELLEPEEQEQEHEIEHAPRDIVTRDHPLNFTWVIWYGPPPKKASGIAGEVTTLAMTSWEDHLQPVKEFNTLEGFWLSYRELKTPCSMEAGASYHLFKKGIKPMWEDPKNIRGGKWSWTIHASDAHKIDLIWEKLIMITVGGLLEGEDGWDHVTGAVLGKKKQGVKMGLWTREASAAYLEGVVKGLGQRVRDMLPLSKNVMMDYSAHNSGVSEPLLRQ